MGKRKHSLPPITKHRDQEGNGVQKTPAPVGSGPPGEPGSRALGRRREAEGRREKGRRMERWGAVSPPGPQLICLHTLEAYWGDFHRKQHESTLTDLRDKVSLLPWSLAEIFRDTNTNTKPNAKGMNRFVGQPRRGSGSPTESPGVAISRPG